MSSETQRTDAPDEKVALRAEQVRLLFAGGSTPLITGAALATIFAFAQWGAIRHEIVLAWVATIWLLSAAGIGLITAYHRAAPGIDASGTWLRRFRCAAVAGGALWGLAGFLPSPAQDVAYQAFLAFALAGVTAGAVIAYSVDLVSVTGFVAPALVPFVLRAFIEGGNVPLALGMIVLLFFCLAVVSGRKLYGHLRENIALRQRAAASEEVLRRREADLRIAAVAFDVQEGIYIADADNKILRVNRAFMRLTGYGAEEAMGQTPAMLRSARHDAAFYRQKRETLARDGYWQGEIWSRRKNGEVYPQWLTISVLYGTDNTVTHYIATFSDMTQYKKAEEAIHNLAFYDSLTGLPNRRMLLDRLHQALAVSARRNQHGAILFIDLDNFKTLNDTRGHDVGDLLLIEMAQRLSACVRAEDTVARLGGDEFVVMLESLSAAAELAATQAEMVGEKILEALHQPYQLRGYEHHSTASAGVSLFRGEAETVDELLKHADAAMYQAKQSGRNAIRFFDPAMQAALESRIRIEAELRRALPQQEFKLYYQAQVSGARQVVGAEVLLRWEHPERGLVPPAQFVPAAEEIGLIVSLGLWVLQMACTQLKRWELNQHTRELQLAVNVSARQFRQEDFVEQVRHTLQQTGANPALLKLELTESMVLHDVADTIKKMQALKALGVSFSMDDFGTGHSSLAQLKRLPLDQVKIDQGFVRDIASDPNDAAIVQTIIAMTGTLGLNVIAEGVETEEQLEFLMQHGCPQFQGNLFGRPVPLAEFEQMLGKSLLQ